MPTCILGTGVSYAKQSIAADLLTSLSITVPAKFAVEERTTVLPLEYIKETKNADTFLSNDAALETCTSLIVEAAKDAIKAAGISVRDIGYIIGDTATPIETTPSEAQRVGRELKLKVPAFDVGSLHAALSNGLFSISALSPDVVPDYVLLVHGNTTSRLIDYSSSEVPLIFSDAGAAAVVSTKCESSIRLKERHCFQTAELASALTIPILNHIEYSDQKMEAGLLRASQWVSEVCAGKELSAVYCNKLLEPFLGKAGVFEVKCVSHSETIGVSGFIALDHACKHADSGAAFGIASAGIGSQSNLLIFEKS